MRERIDRTTGIPLYLQVAEAIRYRISTGELRTNTRLPSLRGAAECWSVNLHTVRRAYAYLEERGYVQTHPRSGTTVLENGDARQRVFHAVERLDDFVDSVRREASDRWGLTAAELARRLEEAERRGSTPVAYVLECSHSQAGDLARQLEAEFLVRAAPWSLDQPGEPPGDGVLVATYFHYGDIRIRWPHRLASVRFLATRPDAGLRGHLATIAGAAGASRPTMVTVCERDAVMARNICADLVRILPPDEVRIEASTAEPRLLLASATDAVLFAPRVWGELPADVRAHPRALEIRYVIEPRELRRFARELTWSPRAAKRA